MAKTELAATFDDLGKTTEGLIAIVSQFPEVASNYEASLGSINAVAGQFAVESGDLITVVRKAGGAFAAAGGKLEELLALFTAVRSTTRESADTIAVGLRTIFARLARPETLDFLRQLGINLVDSEGKIKRPLDAIRQLGFELDKLDSRDPRFSAIVERLGGLRQRSRIIPLLQQVTKAEGALAVAIQGRNSLTREAEVAQLALANQIKKVREEFQAFVRDLLNDAVFRSTIKSILGLASSFIKAADAIRPLIPLLGAVALPVLGPGLFRTVRGASKRVFGANQGGEVPVILTPGEAVFSPRQVQKIGINRLEAMNRKKFNRGGSVNLPSSDSIGMVPGTGHSDTFKTALPVGSFVLNKKSTENLLGEKFAKGGKVNTAKALARKLNSSYSDKIGMDAMSFLNIRNQIDAEEKAQAVHLMNEISSSSYFPEILRNIPRRSTLLGAGTEAVALNTPSHRVIRLGRMRKAGFINDRFYRDFKGRLNSPHVLQPIDSKRFGPFLWELMPKATTLQNLIDEGQLTFDESLKSGQLLNRQMMKDGQRISDFTPENIGFVGNGPLQVIDPGAATDDGLRIGFAKGGRLSGIDAIMQQAEVAKKRKQDFRAKNRAYRQDTGISPEEFFAFSQGSSTEAQLLIEDIGRSSYLPQILSHIPKRTKRLSSGTEALVLETPAERVIRLAKMRKVPESTGILIHRRFTGRLSSPNVLQPIFSKKFGPFLFEKLPKIDTLQELIDKKQISKDYAMQAMAGLRLQMAANNEQMMDASFDNIGISKNKPYVIDPGSAARMGDNSIADTTNAIDAEIWKKIANQYRGFNAGGQVLRLVRGKFGNRLTKRERKQARRHFSNQEYPELRYRMSQHNITPVLGDDSVRSMANPVYEDVDFPDFFFPEDIDLRRNKFQKSFTSFFPVFSNSELEHQLLRQGLPRVSGKQISLTSPIEGHVDSSEYEGRVDSAIMMRIPAGRSGILKYTGDTYLPSRTPIKFLSNFTPNAFRTDYLATLSCWFPCSSISRTSLTPFSG